MHALVQLATRVWLTANGKLERWKQQFTSNLCAEFPSGGHEHWEVCKTLFAHAKSALGSFPGIIGIKVCRIDVSPVTSGVD